MNFLTIHLRTMSYLFHHLYKAFQEVNANNNTFSRGANSNCLSSSCDANNNCSNDVNTNRSSNYDDTNSAGTSSSNTNGLLSTLIDIFLDVPMFLLTRYANDYEQNEAVNLIADEINEDPVNITNNPQ